MKDPWQQNSKTRSLHSVSTNSTPFLVKSVPLTSKTTTVYNDLAHPAATHIGNKYAWRSADGSFNNIDLPDMGKAGTPYSRSVQQLHPLPKNSLPDPGLVFDTLLRREGVRLYYIVRIKQVLTCLLESS